MFVREIGDEFEYRKGNKLYTLKVVEAYGGKCNTCALNGEPNCQNVAGFCGAHNRDYSITIQRVKNLDEEITKTDIQDLTSAIKSIGESFKIVEAFKRLTDQQKTIM